MNISLVVAMASANICGAGAVVAVMDKIGLSPIDALGGAVGWCALVTLVYLVSLQRD